jgi:hypothetical protein
MRRFIIILIVMFFAGCTSLTPNERRVREYSSTAITLSDFSMKITAYYGAHNATIPKNFDANQFFNVLEKVYPDQSRVRFIKQNYKVSARYLEGNLYSVMLCEPENDVKIMEDINCHLNYVEIQPWKTGSNEKCLPEDNWESYCQ